jgi:hypothetical protein
MKKAIAIRIEFKSEILANCLRWYDGGDVLCSLIMKNKKGGESTVAKK